MTSTSTELRSLRSLPGPRGLPLLGNLLQIRPQTLHRSLEGWARQFGTVFRFRAGSRDVVVVSDAASVQQILRDRPEGFGRLGAVQPMFAEMGLDFLFSAEGESWKRQRRIWMASLNAQQLKTFHEGLARITRRLLLRWQRAADAGQTMDVLPECMRYTVDVTMLFAFGHDANTVEGDKDVIQRYLNQIFPAIGRRLLAPFPYWRYVRLPVDRELERALAAVRAEVQRVIESARERLRSDPARQARPSCLLEAMLAARDEGGTLSDDEVFANTFGALVAGEDTSASTLAWIVHYLTLDPALLKKVRDEADTLLGPWHPEAEGVVDEARFPPYLPATDAIINEVLRVRPVAPIIHLATLGDRQIGDVRVPAGTYVMLLMRAAAGAVPPDADAARFAPATDGVPPAEAAPGRAPTLPFGYGPRLCPGRNLAIAELRSATLMLARNFTAAARPDASGVSESLQFSMIPLGLNARLQRRA